MSFNYSNMDLPIALNLTTTTRVVEESELDRILSEIMGDGQNIRLDLDALLDVFEDEELLSQPEPPLLEPVSPPPPPPPPADDYVDVDDDYSSISSYSTESNFAETSVYQMCLGVRVLSDTGYMPRPYGPGIVIYAAKEVIVASLSRCVIDTDISLKLPTGYYGEILPYTQSATQYGLVACTTIVQEHTMEPLQILLFNTSDTTQTIMAGAPIAILLFKDNICPNIIRL